MYCTHMHTHAHACTQTDTHTHTETHTLITRVRILFEQSTGGSHTHNNRQSKFIVV